MAQTWSEVKALLDDPSVPAETKQQLLYSWSYENLGKDAYGDHRGEIEKYQDAYGVPSPGLGIIPKKSAEDAYDEAKKEAHRKGYNDDQQKQKVDEGKTELEGKTAPTADGTGTKNSDELFDAAEPSLKVFANFGPLLGQVPGDCKGNTEPIDYDKHIKTPFNQQRGIDFAKFLTDAGRFGTGSATVEQTTKDTSGALNTLFKDWRGDAANATSDRFNDKILPKATELSDTLTAAEEATSTAVQTVFELCKGKAEAVTKLYTNIVAKADKPMAQKVFDIANGKAAEKEDLGAIAGWMDLNFGTNLREKLNDDGCCDDDEIKEQGRELAKDWIRDYFNPDMWDNLYLTFKETCETTKKNVDTAYGELGKVMGAIENEFEGEKEGTTPPIDDGGDDKGGDDKGGNDKGGNDKGGGSSTGNGGGSGSGTTPAADGKPEPGTNPVTGKPLEIDPKTGEPYPIDPETGEAIKDTGDDQDTLTVQKGDNKIEMTEPDKDGKMEISVDDGTPPPKEYRLDFGTGEGTEGQPALVGPDGKVYTPGPDGKIHIEDGNLKISAEQPEGPDGPTVVTVDDGTGEPTTYTLGEKDETKDDKAAEGGKPDDGDTADPVKDPAAPADDDFAAPGGLDLDGNGTAGPDGAAAAGGDGGGSGGAGPAGAPTEPQSVPAAGDLFGGGDTGGVGGGDPGVGAGLGEAPDLESGAQSGAATPSQVPLGAGVAVAPGGEVSAAPAGGAQSGAAMGGMPMMGGMGGGGGGGGDQQRSSQYRVDGGLFETSGSGARISGSLDEEGDRSIRYDR